MINSHNYKYIIAEDEKLLRRNLIKKINSLMLPLQMVGEASNGKDASELIDKYYPDVVITDVSMPQKNGIELAKYINENYPSIHTIIISGYSDFNYAQSAIKYNVKDYLLKPVDKDSLFTSLQKILIKMDKENKDITNKTKVKYSLHSKDICELMKDYLKENYCSDVSVGEMAEYFGFSPEYLGKIFKKYTGETPYKYLQKLRINEAKHLLISRPDLEIQTIGQLVGYKDAFYFSRSFKSHVGMHPSNYRSKIIE